MIETVLVQMINQNAHKLLADMEECGLIRILRAPIKMSSLRGQIRIPISNEEIDKQLNAMREEWERGLLS